MAKSCTSCRIEMPDSDSVCLKCGGELVPWQPQRVSDHPQDLRMIPIHPAVLVVHVLGAVLGAAAGWALGGVQGAWIGAALSVVLVQVLLSCAI